MRSPCPSTVGPNQSRISDFTTPTSKGKKRELSSPPVEETQIAKRQNVTMGTSKDDFSIKEYLEQMEARMTQSFKQTIKDTVAESIDEKLKPIQESIDQLLDTKNETERFQGEVSNLITQTSNITARCTNIESENNLLKDRLNTLENKLLDCSLIINGISEDLEETEEDRKEKIFMVIANTVIRPDPIARLEVARNVPIKCITRLGRFNAERGRPISVTFVNKSDADHLYECKSKVGKGIYVEREYCQETERERKFLRPILRECRRNKNYHGSFKMEEGRIKIKGKWYQRDNIHQLPKDISAFVCSSKSDENSVGFFGELNPLSNFHPCQFEWNGIKFHSSEQFIQYQKALLFKDNQTAGMILKSSTPLECKRLADNVVNCVEAEWNEKAKELCKEGIKAKFAQNPHLSEVLLDTEDKVLVESGYDKVWGTGIPLHDVRCLDSTAWGHQGILGELLSEIRHEL